MTAPARTIDLSSQYKPTPKQWIAHTSPECFILFGGSVGGGKSVWLVNEGPVQLSLDYPGNRGFIGRWENTVFKSTTFLTLQEFLPSELIARHHLSGQYYDLINGSRIYYGGLKPSKAGTSLDHLKRFPELGWFAIDEASQVPEEYFLMLASRLRLNIPGIRYKALLASNPEPGWLRTRFIDQKLPDHKFVPALPGDNPHLPDDYVEKLNALFPPEWIERYLEGSWDIMLEGNYVFPYPWVRSAIERNLEPGEPRRIGIDFAAGGADLTVAMLREGPVVRPVYRSSFNNTMRTTGELAAILDEYKPDRATMDPIGVGKGPFDRLIEQGYDVIPYIAGDPAREKKRFLNKRAEDHWHFREELEEGRVDLPDDDKIIAQLCSIKYHTRSDKVIQIWSKEEMKAAGIKSPDDAEATIQCFSESKTKRKASVFVGGRRRDNEPLAIGKAKSRRGGRRRASVSIV